MHTNDPVYLIDGSACFYRAYHAIGPLSNTAGLPTNATYGFTAILLRVLREKKPRYLAVAYDARGPNFRHAIYPDYKANRPPMPEDLAVQIPYIKKIVAAYNILTMETPGFEADDLIASSATALAAAGFPVIIVSGDKDLLQLVDDRISLWDPMKDGMMDPAAVRKKYNIPPEQLLDFFALTGDASDNIPGVPGVGPKTAASLINEYRSIEGIYADLDRISRKKLKENLENHKDAAFLSRELISLRYDLEIPAAPEAYSSQKPDLDSLKTLFTELEFHRLLKSEIPAESVSTKGFSLVQTEAELRELVASLATAPQLVLDTETTDLEPLNAGLVGISLCTATDRAFYIPIGHRQPTGESVPGQLPATMVLDALRPFLENPALPKIGHNLKFDYAVLVSQPVGAIRLAGQFQDTMVASYLLAPGRRTHKLDDLCHELLELKMTSFAEVTANDKRPDAFAMVAVDKAKDYSCEDVYGALRLWQLFEPRLIELDLWELFDDLESALIPLLADMELSGVLVDTGILAGLTSEFSTELTALEQEIHALAGEEFNINSTQQLGEILFEKLNLPHGRKTKTGYSTDVKVLEKLAPLHDLPRLVSLHRNLTKLKSTYVDKLPGQVNPRTGRVHTSFNQTVTATGRLSSSNPNLQNIPIRTPEGQRIRAAFIPAPGHLFVAGDYSQIDLRVLAHYSQDPALLAAFRSNQDIHNQTAAEIFMVSPLLITKEMRRVAKTINFGIVYGMSSFGLASQLDLSRKSAQTFIDRYFDHFTGVKKFMADIVLQAAKDGYVTTLLNRRRPLPDISSPNRTRREFAERTAINTPIQGTAADIIKLAMLAVDNEMKKTGLKSRMVLQIHDELVFEVPENEVEVMTALARESMEQVMTLDVPLVVNMSVGRNLAEV